VSTRSIVAFRDDESTTGIYVHFDGYPEGRLPVLREIYTATLHRDLHQMRTVLLKHRAGWSQLSTDTGLTFEAADRSGFLDVPGVGVAYTDDTDMTVTGPAVFDQEYAYVFDMDDRSLDVYDGAERIMHIPEAAWAPIGPLCLHPTLPIIALGAIGAQCLNGVTPAYTGAHISGLMRHLDLADGDRLRIDNGGDLYHFFGAAVDAGLLPGTTWFIVDGETEASEGGWIGLPAVMPTADVHTLFIAAADLGDHGMDAAQAIDTRTRVRDVLIFLASRIAAAAADLKQFTAGKPVFVLNIRHPDEATRTYSHGAEPEVHALDLGDVFDSSPASESVALEWAAEQLVRLHDWPLPLRLRAMLTIGRAVRRFQAATAFANALGRQHVDPAAVEHARFATGRLTTAGDEDRQRQESLNAWLAQAAAPAPKPGYAEACRRAATAQGLDPICQALSKAGIGHGVEQTGGFCMMVRVPTPHGYHFGITAAEQPDTDSSGHWLVARYSDDEDQYDGGEVVGAAIPTADVITLLRGHLSRASEPPIADAVSTAVNTAVDWLKDELDVREGPVDDLLNLVVNATVYATKHPHDGTLADAIEANYDGTGCPRDCDDDEDCEDPDHNNVVAEVLSWIAPLG